MNAGGLVGLLMLLAAALWTYGPAAAAAGATADIKACLQNINKAQAVFPGDATYQQASSVFNTRFQPKPAAVFYAKSAQDASAAVKCAAASGVKVSPSGGRQSFQGWTVLDGYLVVDVTGITQVTPSADNKTVTIGAGNNGVMVQTAVHNLDIPGALVPGGYCSFVGVSGWILGGGYGIPGRYLGLGCDQVVSYELVLANGDIVQATAEENADLFWASCGSGGGTFGIATSFEYRLNVLPDEGQVTFVSVNHELGAPSVQAFVTFQQALPTLDKRYGLVYGLNDAFTYSGLFFGAPEEALQGLESAGLLLNLNKDSTNPDSLFADKYPYGLNLVELPSTWDAVKLAVPQWSGDFLGQEVPWQGGSFTGTPEDEEWVLSVMNGEAPGGHVVGGIGYNGWLGSRSRLVRQLSQDAVQAIVDYGAARKKVCRESSSPTLDCLFSVGGHVLGGAYADRPANASAYPHRDKLFVVDATITVPTSIVALAPDDIPKLANKLLDDFMEIFKPYLQQPEAAYVNYLLPELENWQTAYFGSNYPRLQEIKAKYDPTGLFDKPYTVQGATGGNNTGGGTSSGTGGQDKPGTGAAGRTAGVQSAVIAALIALGVWALMF